MCGCGGNANKSFKQALSKEQQETKEKQAFKSQALDSQALDSQALDSQVPQLTGQTALTKEGETDDDGLSEWVKILLGVLVGLALLVGVGLWLWYRPRNTAPDQKEKTHDRKSMVVHTS